MNQLHQGDNLAILRNMPNASVDLICTDPPFNSRAFQNGAYLPDDKGYSIEYDDKSYYKRPPNTDGGKDYKWHSENNGHDFYFLSQFCTPSELPYFFAMIPVIQECKRILKKGGGIYWQCDHRTNWIFRLIFNKIFSNRQCFINEIIWHYPNKSPMPCLKKSYSINHNYILFYVRQHGFNKLAYDFNLECEVGTKKKMGAVWNIPMAKGRARVGYPTQKPRELYERMIRASSNQSDTVLDPFAGSGTTLDAAHTLGRAWIGIDVGDEAINVIQGRLRERHGLEYDRDYQLIR